MVTLKILKHSLISNKIFFNYLNKNNLNILKLRSPFIEKQYLKVAKKKRIVEKDEKEKNLRKILNFGHTFAHAYEATLGYSKKLNHGEAVLLGMYSALNFSLKKKFLKKKEFYLNLNHLKNFKLNFKLNNYFSSKDVNKLVTFMSKDKKNSSKKINLILLKKIGFPIINKTFTNDIIKYYLKKELQD